MNKDRRYGDFLILFFMSSVCVVNEKIAPSSALKDLPSSSLVNTLSIQL